MATKTITIKEEAYEALKNLKMDNESFSDTILRISKLFTNLKELWGAGTKTEEEYEAEIEEIERRRRNFFQGRD